MPIKLNGMVENQKRWWDPIAGISLFLLVFFTAYSLELTYWTFDLNRITSIALLGVLSGILIGQSSFKRIFSIFLASIYGVGIFLWQFVFSLSNELNWLTRLESLLCRFRSAISQVFQNVPLDDGILFLAFMAFSFTIISIAVGYTYTRTGKPFLPLSIIAFIFFTIQFFMAPFNRKFLLILLYGLFLILFLGRLHYLTQKDRWETLDYQEDKETANFLTREILILSLVFTAFAWGIPFLSERLSFFKNQEDNNSRRNYSESFERVRNILYPLRLQQDSFGDGVFTEIISLGDSRSRDDGPVFFVEPPPMHNFPGRYYWRARVFSSYEDGYWSNEAVELSQLKFLDLNPYHAFSNELLLYTFTYEINKEELITPQVTVDLDRNAEVAYFMIDEDSQDVMDFIDYGVVRPGDQVKVLGGFYEFSFQESSGGKSEYSKWLEDRYLLLPSDLSEKVYNLAEELTRGKASTFEKVLTVTNYLRNTYRYKDEVDIPQFEEPIEWFLFTGREGYCNYFASSEVLMLRSIGIPSRFVVGYAQGELSEDGSGFEVSIKDSHSWVEVFFPEIGWIIFEPTPSQPGLTYVEQNLPETLLDRRERFSLEGPPNEDVLEREAFLEINQAFFEKDELEVKPLEEKRGRWILWLIPLPILLLLAYFIYQFVILREKAILLPVRITNQIEKRQKTVPGWLKHWAQYEQLSLIEKQFHNIKFTSNISGLIEKANRTPKEYFDELAEVILSEKEIIVEFSGAYHQSLFSQEKFEYEDEIRQAYRGVIKAMVLTWIDSIKEFIQFRLKLLKIR